MYCDRRVAGRIGPVCGLDGRARAEAGRGAELGREEAAAAVAEDDVAGPRAPPTTVLLAKRLNPANVLGSAADPLAVVPT